MRCPRRVSKKRVLCILCVVFVIFVVHGALKVKKSIEFKDPTCEQLKAHQKIDKLCEDYKAGKTGGNLCRDLCLDGKLVLNDCLAHKNTTIIFFGQWRGDKIAFKTKKEPHVFDTLRTAAGEPPGESKSKVQSSISQETFSKVLHNHIQNQLSFPRIQQMYSPNDLLKLLWAPHDLKNMTHGDMEGLWLLLQRDEFIKFQLLKNLTHIPKVRGFCGQFYAVEQAKTLDEIALGPFKVRTTWKEKVRLTLQLLELQHELHNSQLGPLHHCDVQPSNFGLTTNRKLVALDLDTVFTTSLLMDYLEQPSCTEDKNCDFFDCMAACNKSVGKCTRKILTNNLQIICRDLLRSPHWGQPGLLTQMPMYYDNLLRPILRKCDPGELPWKQDKIQKLSLELHSLMQSALDER